MGRISSGQVKLRGQRIELGEIEHAASKVSPAVMQVVASVLDGQLIVFCIVERSRRYDRRRQKRMPKMAAQLHGSERCRAAGGLSISAFAGR